MLTLPGGAAIVLSTWLMTRWVRRTERRAAAAEAQANAATAVAAEEKRAAAAEAAAALQAEVERLRAQN